MDILYRTNATVTGGRTGHGRSEDGLLDIQLETAKELGGSGNGTNPEQLFGVGYAACFLGAIRFVASQRKIRIADEANVTASVGIGKRDDGRGFGLDVALAVDLPGIDAATAQELVDAAHVVCPYSEATRNNLNVRLSVVERA